MSYIDVTPLQEPLPDNVAFFHLPGDYPTLAVSEADYLKLVELLGGEANALEGRVVEFSEGPDAKVRIKVIAS